MGFFSKRVDPSSPAVAESAADSVAAVRQRAKHRLIGAVALVAVAVVVFPLLFESKPRPIPVDLPIEIPRKEGAAPLTLPPARTEAPVAPAAPVTPTASQVVQAESAKGPAVPASKPEDAKPEVKAETKAEPKPEVKVEAKAEPKGPPKPEAKLDEAARAKALLEGKTPEATAGTTSVSSTGRFVVQAGAYTDSAKVREVRQKIERAGFKTFTQVVKSSEGERIRVRIGPYPSRDEANKAAAKLKDLGLDAGVLSL